MYTIMKSYFGEYISIQMVCDMKFAGCIELQYNVNIRAPLYKFYARLCLPAELWSQQANNY